VHSTGLKLFARPHTIKSLLAAFLIATSAAAVELKKKTVDVYEAYVAAAEQQIDNEQRGPQFFWGSVTSQEQKLQAGEILVEKAVLDTKKLKEVPDGLLHHWSGFIFIPNVKLQQVLTLLQDYNHHSEYYKPEVAQAKILQRDGGHFLVFLRFVKKKVITVVMNTEHDVRYVKLDATRAYSRSHTTRVAEVESPGSPDEREKPPGTGGGFMWRMDTYWRFLQTDNGVYVRCDAISLTRDVPTGLGWLVGPFITSIPKDSLVFTLTSTRNALTKR
jgi:hypothetical protein